MKTIERQVEDEFHGEFGEDAATEVETVENDKMLEGKTSDVVLCLRKYTKRHLRFKQAI